MITTITYNGRKIRSYAHEGPTVERALSVAERWGLDAATWETDVPRTTIYNLCKRAGIDPTSYKDED